MTASRRNSDGLHMREAVPLVAETVLAHGVVWACSTPRLGPHRLLHLGPASTG